MKNDTTFVPTRSNDQFGDAENVKKKAPCFVVFNF